MGMLLFAAIVTGLSIGGVRAQAFPNTITVENRSGEDAVVKLIAPCLQELCARLEGNQAQLAVELLR